VTASPITLESETELAPRPMASFNAVMAEAVRRTGDAGRSHALRQRLSSAVSRRTKSLRILRQKLGRQLGQLSPPGKLRQRGETLLAGLRQAERIDDAHVRLPDPFHPEGRLIEIEIDPRLGLPENAERMFRRSRKAERTEVALGRRLEEVEQQLEYVEGVRVSLDDATGPGEHRELDDLDDLESIRREMEEQNLLAPEKVSVRSQGDAKRLPPRSFTTRRGNVVLVGRSARSNAELTFRLAGPNDLWLHASGMPGSHVVLKRSGSHEPDDEDIVEAAGYAAYFSKGRHDTHVDVMVTARRNVAKIKGAPPGLVRVANVKTVRVRPKRPPGS
jgi:predicted ribosome quality control (RQC) complex YloA/Tae2 family protein